MWKNRNESFWKFTNNASLFVITEHVHVFKVADIFIIIGCFLKTKKWNCVCSVDVSATISVCEWCTPLLMKVSTPKHKKVNKKYLPHKFRSFFLAQHFCLFFAFKHTLSPPLYLHHNRHYIASRFTPPPPPSDTRSSNHWDGSWNRNRFRRGHLLRIIHGHLIFRAKKEKLFSTDLFLFATTTWFVY